MIHLTDDAESALGVETFPTNGSLPLDTGLLERVIQRIFTAGLLLGTATNEATGRGTATIERGIAQLDEALRDIRGEVLRDSAHID